MVFFLSGKLKYQWVHFSFLFGLFLAEHTDFKATDDPTMTTLKKIHLSTITTKLSGASEIMFNLSLLRPMTHRVCLSEIAELLQHSVSFAQKL